MAVKNPLKILMISSEAIPFAKSGGLADVVPTLAKYLSEDGHDARLVMPRYYSIDRTLLHPHPGLLEVRMGNSIYKGQLHIGHVPGSEVPVYFIDHEPFFGRDGIYASPSEGDYQDNALRFAFLCKAAFALCRLMHWIPDILHAHDWPAAPALGYLNTIEAEGPFSKTASVYSIHNVGYQGSFPQDQFGLLDMPWSEFRPGSFEFYGSLNFMQGALRNATMISTVSPGYANEITTAQFGYGMEGILDERKDSLVGILNGMDYSTWDPSADEHIPYAFDHDSLEGKAKNKAYLQEQLGLPVNPDAPIISLVSRMASQKGFVELVAPGHGILEKLLNDFPVQVIILGTGERWCEEELLRLARIYPRLKVQLTYNERLSHLIQAGSDFFLMPSHYEPCGLTQMYALRYGTIPIVSPTGGLLDTVIDARLNPAEATGLYIEMPVSPQTIYHGVRMAIHYWDDHKDKLAAMQKRGMQKRFGWEEARVEYNKLYETALKRKRG